MFVPRGNIGGAARAIFGALARHCAPTRARAGDDNARRCAQNNYYARTMRARWSSSSSASCGDGGDGSCALALEEVERRIGRLMRTVRALEARKVALERDASEDDVSFARCAAESERARAEMSARKAREAREALTDARRAARETREEATRMACEKLAPMIASAREECEILKEEIESGARRARALGESREASARRAREVEDACDGLRKVLSGENERASACKSAPSTIRGAKDAVFEVLCRARIDAEAMDTTAKALRRAENDAAQSMIQGERELLEIRSINARFDEQIGTTNQGLNDIEALVESESMSRDAIAAEGVRHELNRRACEKSLSRSKQLVIRDTRTNAQLTYKINQALTHERAIAESVDELREMKLVLNLELETSAADTKHVIEDQRVLTLDVNTRREECKAELTKGDLLAHTVNVTLRGEIGDLEEDVAGARREEAARNRIQKCVIDKVARATKRQHIVQHSIDSLSQLIKIRDREIYDLKSCVEDARTRRVHFEQLTALAKTQRDAFATVARKTVALAHALRFKNKDLESQKGTFERDMREKDVLVSKVRAETELLQRARDARRAQSDDLAQVVIRAQADVDIGETEINKLKDALKSGKIEQKRLYVQAKSLVKSRQAVALELLDRNAELCQLCDRVATSEHVSRQCEEELASRVHECETLRRSVHDIERSLVIARRRAALIPEYEAEIASKSATLHEMQTSAENLSKRLEDPNEHVRWRLVHGPKGAEDQIDVASVNDKLASIGVRLEDKERELARQRLKCREIEEETARIQVHVNENADSALETTSALNRAKSKLSAMERALLAVVSELTMYRALTATLANEKSRNIAKVDALRLHIETQDASPPVVVSSRMV